MVWLCHTLLAWLVSAASHVHVANYKEKLDVVQQLCRAQNGKLAIAGTF